MQCPLAILQAAPSTPCAATPSQLTCLRSTLHDQAGMTDDSYAHLQIEQLFSSSFSLHAEDAADKFGKAAAAAQQEQQHAAELQPAPLQSSSDPPLDWSIKTCVRFSSAEPFAIAEEALSASAGTGKLLA